MRSRACSIRHLFQRCLTQYDKLMRRKAFLDNYEQHSMFKVRSCGLSVCPETLTRDWARFLPVRMT